jgi:hypothetical protein
MCWAKKCRSLARSSSPTLFHLLFPRPLFFTRSSSLALSVPLLFLPCSCGCSDSDELFLPRVHPTDTACEAGSVVRHFAALAAAGCEQFVYYNFEAVPEVLPPSANEPPAEAAPPPGGPPTDPFAQIELFKRPEVLVPWRSNSTALAALDSWRRRTRAGKFFLYYENGKCACRVDTDGLYVPVSVHMCLPRFPDGKWNESRLHTRVWTNDFRNETARALPSETSCILHYPAWDPQALWHKYVLHGNFSDKLVSGKTHKQGLQWGECFHIECRDVYLASKSDSDGGYAAMLALFRKTVMLSEPAEAARQIELGLLTRIPHALGLLADGRNGTSAGAPLPLPRPVPAPPAAAKKAQEAAPAAVPSPPMTAAEALLAPVWTAGQVRYIEPWQLHGDYAVERASWRGPKRWRARLSRDQLEALRMMAGSNK